MFKVAFRENFLECMKSSWKVISSPVTWCVPDIDAFTETLRPSCDVVAFPLGIYSSLLCPFLVPAKLLLCGCVQEIFIFDFFFLPFPNVEITSAARMLMAEQQHDFFFLLWAYFQTCWDDSSLTLYFIIYSTAIQKSFHPLHCSGDPQSQKYSPDTVKRAE